MGADPSEKGIILLFFGILLAINQWETTPDFIPSEDKKGKRGRFAGFIWGIPALLFVVLYFIVFAAGNASAEKAVTEYAGEAEDFVLDTEYTWNENDYVSIIIPKEKIKLSLKEETKRYDQSKENE
jgi:hypothetical protein